MSNAPTTVSKSDSTLDRVEGILNKSFDGWDLLVTLVKTCGVLALYALANGYTVDACIECRDFKSSFALNKVVAS